MTRACQIVLLGSLAAASGCYLDHGRGGMGMPAPVRPVDGGVRLDAPAPRPDAPGPAPLCPALRADFTCLESFLVAPGRAFSLPYAFDGCACCVESSCSVAVDPGTRTLRIETTLCPDPCDCAACNLPGGTCDVPALDEGDWSVIANGEPAFVLPVHGDGGRTPPPPACATYAEIDTCAPSTALPGRLSEDAACVEPIRSGRFVDAIRVHHECWSCGDLVGACVARLEPRFTDDLPPGGEIFLEPTAYGTGCDVDCPAICMAATRDCIVPPLVDGHTYRVHLGARTLTTFVAGAPAPPCLETHD